MTGDDTDDRAEGVDRAVRFAILVGVALALGLVGILVVGLGARIEGLSTGTFMQVVVVVVLLWPAYRLAPWQPALTERVRGWVRSNQTPVVVAAVLILVSRLPFTPGLLSTLVQLPYSQTAGVFFGVELFYRPYVGFELGTAIRRVGQWYVTTLFVLLVSVFVVHVGESVRSAVSDAE